MVYKLGLKLLLLCGRQIIRKTEGNSRRTPERHGAINGLAALGPLDGAAKSLCLPAAQRPATTVGEPRVKPEILVSNRNHLWALSPGKQEGKGLKFIWAK
jgi:hypothetical protein